MTKAMFILLVAIGLAGVVRAAPIPEEGGPEARLLLFLEDEERNETIRQWIDQLDADSFAERERASAKLAGLPSLPASVRQMATSDERPEVRSRLRKLVALRPVEKETANLNEALGQVAGEKVVGMLGVIARIVQVGMWAPDQGRLERAARATVTEEDLPLLQELAASPSVVLRRLAAAAYGGLPPEKSTAALRGLLDDADPSVVLVAASELARQDDPACLPAFARLLDESDFYVRHRSWSALKGLSGETFGYDPSAKPEVRQPMARRWQEWAGGSDVRIVGELPESSAVALFNGSDLTGWTVRNNDQLNPEVKAWEVQDGAIVALEGAGRGDLRTTARFENYVLTLRYRIDAPGGDGGIGIMLTEENEKAGGGLRGDEGRYLEVQILPNRAGDLYTIGGFGAQANGKRIAFSTRRTAEVDDAAGQWHSLKLTVRDGEVEVAINGTVVNRATEGAKGPGRILLRNEGHWIAYKDLLLLPIEP